MSLIFRKIFAKESLFIKIREKHKKEHDYFQQYADELSKKSSNDKNKLSGKGRSYAAYLMRLIILYQENFNTEIENILTFKTLKEIEKVVTSEKFKKYNQEENRFPNATFNCYISCVAHLNSEKENVADRQLNDNLEIITDKDNDNYHVIKSAQKRKDKEINGNIFTYPRSKYENFEAKKRSHWECDLNNNHFTFINKSDGNPYMEGHHLIPMSVQDYYEHTLDFADNIVCLCPNCHRKIHYAEDEQKKELLEVLFNKQKNKYSNFKININFKDLLTFYEIL